MTYASPINVDTKFIDCDFTDSQVRGSYELGCAERDDVTGDRFDVFEDTIGIIPRNQWTDAIRRIDQLGGSADRLVTHVFDQGREGTCTSNQTCAGHMVTQAVQFGRDRVAVLSPISLYMRCAPNSRVGSSVGENLQEARDRGILPQDTLKNRGLMGDFFEHSMSATGYDKRKYSPGWGDTARFFRNDEYYDIRSSDGFVSALLRGFVVGYGRSGHSILAVRPVIRNNDVYVIYINSWGQDWGDTLHNLRGWGYDSPRMYGAGAQRYGCYAIRTAIVPPWER